MFSAYLLWLFTHNTAIEFVPKTTWNAFLPNLIHFISNFDHHQMYLSFILDLICLCFCMFKNTITLIMITHNIWSSFNHQNLNDNLKFFLVKLAVYSTLWAGRPSDIRSHPRSDNRTRDFPIFPFFYFLFLSCTFWSAIRWMSSLDLFCQSLTLC